MGSKIGSFFNSLTVKIALFLQPLIIKYCYNELISPSLDIESLMKILYRGVSEELAVAAVTVFATILLVAIGGGGALFRAAIVIVLSDLAR